MPPFRLPPLHTLTPDFLHFPMPIRHFDAGRNILIDAARRMPECAARKWRAADARAGARERYHDAREPAR